MLLIATVLAAVVIAIHVYIVLIETVLFRTRGRKVFGLEEGQVDALAWLMSNQGCYNGFLAAMLAVGLVHPDAHVGRAFVVFGLACVAIAGVWSTATVSRRVLFGTAAWPYEKLGFSTPDNSKLFWHINRPDIYKKPPE